MTSAPLDLAAVTTVASVAGYWLHITNARLILLWIPARVWWLWRGRRLVRAYQREWDVRIRNGRITSGHRTGIDYRTLLDVSEVRGQIEARSRGVPVS